MKDEFGKTTEEILEEIKAEERRKETNGIVKESAVQYTADKQLYSVEGYFELEDFVEYELIYGRLVHYNSPGYSHQRSSFQISKRFDDYITSNKGKCKVIPAPFCVVLDEVDAVVVQPDISIICNTELIKNEYCYGAPDIIVEVVSPSNKNRDYHQKVALYKEYGVKEYWIIDLELERVTLYNMVNGGMPQISGMEDTIYSTVLNGFALNLQSICDSI